MSIDENKDNAPYPGLRPYREDEKAKFFGRDVDAEILIDKVLTNRLTLLFAASGVGKSSLLQAAVIPHLKSKTGENLTVVYHTDWVSDPVRSVRDAVLQALHVESLLPEHSEEAEFGEKLPDLLAFCEVFVRPPLVLILDQFEEFFRYQRHQTGFRELIDQLTTIITDKSLPVHLILSMREDFALELNAFKPKLPTILFENFYRLEKLGRQAVRDAIVIPAEQRGFTYEPELLKQLLADLLSREMDRQPNSPVVELLETVEPPYMQIVCARLWELNAGDSEKVLRLASYEKAGRAKGILKNYLDGVLQQFSFAEKQLASAAFDHLVSLRGVKMAYTAEALAETVRVDEGELAKVLKRLEDVRILREIPRQNELWYELYHDMFSGSIEDWNNVWKDRVRRRQVAKVAGGVVFGVGVIFAGWDYYINASNYHFRLSPKQSSEQVELWQGKPESFDFFGVQRYLAETGVKRHDLEPDKQFHEKLVAEYDDLQMELVANQSIDDRIFSYAVRGKFNRAFELTEKSAAQVNTGLLKRVLPNIAEIKTPRSVHFIYETLQKSPSKNIRRLISGERDYFSNSDFFNERSKIIKQSFGAILSDKSDFFFGNGKALPDSDEGRKALFYAFSNQVVRKYFSTKVLELIDKGFFNVDNNKIREVVLTFPDPSQVTLGLQALVKKDSSDLLSITALGDFDREYAITVILKNLKESNFGSYSFLSNRSQLVEELIEIQAKEAAPELILLLSHSDHIVRIDATKALGGMKIKEAIPNLIALLDDTNDNVRLAAIGALGKLKVKRVVQTLIGFLKNHPSNHYEIIEALVNIDAKEAIPALINLLKDKSNINRSTLISALKELQATEAIPILIDMLKTHEDNWQYGDSLQYIVAMTLKKLKANQLIPKILGLLNDESSRVRDTTITTLGKLRLTEAIPNLEVLSRGKDSHIRRLAIRALVTIKFGEIPPDFDRLLENNNEKSHHTVLMLSEGNLKEATPIILELLANKDTSIHSSLIKLIKNYNIKTTIPYLLDLLASERNDLNHILTETLMSFDLKNFIPRLLQLLYLENSSTQIAAIRILKNMNVQDSIPKLKSFINHDDVNLQRAAIDALGELGVKNSIPELLRFIEHENHILRKASIAALAHLSAREVVPSLESLLISGGEDFSGDISKSLEKLDSKESIPKLLDVINQVVKWNRRHIVNLLVKNNDKHFMPYLMNGLNENLISKGSYRHEYRLLHNLEASSRISSGELLGFLLQHLSNRDRSISESAIITSLRMLRNGKLSQIQKRLLQKALIQADQKDLDAANRRLVVEDKKEAEEQSKLLKRPINQPGLEEKALTLKDLKQKLISMGKAYISWRKRRDSEFPSTNSESSTTEIEKSDLTDPAPFIYEYAYAIAHESEPEGIKLLGHNLYKVREAAARGLANGDALGVELLKKLEKAWLETKDPIERQGIYHAIDIALLAIEGVGYKKELADLKAYEPTLTNERSAASIKPRVEWTRIQLQWRVDANQELEELAARQLPKLLKEYCLNEDGTDMKPEECTIE